MTSTRTLRSVSLGLLGLGFIAWPGATTNLSEGVVPSWAGLVGAALIAWALWRLLSRPSSSTVLRWAVKGAAALLGLVALVAAGAIRARVWSPSPGVYTADGPYASCQTMEIIQGNDLNLGCSSVAIMGPEWLHREWDGQFSAYSPMVGGRPAHTVGPTLIPLGGLRVTDLKTGETRAYRLVPTADEADRLLLASMETEWTAIPWVCVGEGGRKFAFWLPQRKMVGWGAEGLRRYGTVDAVETRGTMDDRGLVSTASFTVEWSEGQRERFQLVRRRARAAARSLHQPPIDFMIEGPVGSQERGSGCGLATGDFGAALEQP